MPYPRDLGDWYLWQETAETAEALAQVARQGARIAEGNAPAADADARAALIAAHRKRWQQLMHEYEADQAELERRYPELRPSLIELMRRAINNAKLMVPARR